MLAFALGLAWLVMAPLCLWLVIRGRTPARIGAVLTLALLEAGTIALNSAQEHPAPAVVAHDVPPARQPAGCPERTPVPENAVLAHHHASIELTWAAAADECPTAKVVLRHKGAKLRIWVHEGVLHGEHKGVTTVPVHVSEGKAALQLPLDPPLPARSGYHAVDGRTGKLIPR